ncbi:MAG: class A beta-lactamase-related serine hydrolase [Gemmatimonadaceae bacterium]|nr:class A beta-lactamase-related serine hydrolase [Gemmatimonadaceae bacterium]
MFLRHVLLLALGAATACRAPASRPAPTGLLDAWRARIARSAGAEVALYYRSLAPNAPAFTLDADRPMHPASTMKVPVMIELFRRIDAGTIAPDSSVVLQNRFASIVDGSPYTLDAGDDSDSLLYTKVGTRVTLTELDRRMIVRSSNLATNVLVEQLGGPAITATAAALGANGMIVRRGVEDTKAFQAGLNNSTTARALGVLMEAIALGRAASPRSTTAMLETLRAQEFNDEIPAGLPAGTPVAHKTGWITATTHDAAIVSPPGRSPFVLVILTRAIPDRATAQRLMADLARITWEFDQRR